MKIHIAVRKKAIKMSNYVLHHMFSNSQFNAWLERRKFFFWFKLVFKAKSRSVVASSVLNWKKLNAQPYSQQPLHFFSSTSISKHCSATINLTLKISL